MSWYAMKRGWMDSPVFADEPYTEREAWEWIISEASYDGKKKFNISGFPEQLPMGCLSFSYSFLAKAWKWNKAKVCRVLKRYEEWGMIETEMKRQQSVVKVLNYTKYQPNKNDIETVNDTEVKRKTERKCNKHKEVKEVEEVKEDITPISPLKEMECFEDFWIMFPRQRRGNKEKAEIAYRKAIKENRATEKEIIDGVRKYQGSDEVQRGYAKGAAAWLNDDRWSVDYTVTQRDERKADYMDGLATATANIHSRLQEDTDQHGMGDGFPEW